MRKKALRFISVNRRAGQSRWIRKAKKNAYGCQAASALKAKRLPAAPITPTQTNVCISGMKSFLWRKQFLEFTRKMYFLKHFNHFFFVSHQPFVFFLFFLIKPFFFSPGFHFQKLNQITYVQIKAHQWLIKGSRLVCGFNNVFQYLHHLDHSWDPDSSLNIPLCRCGVYP